MSDDRKRCPICNQIEGTQEEYFKATVTVMRGFCFARVTPSEEGQRDAAERDCTPPDGWRDGFLRMATKLDEIVRITDNSPGCDPVAAVRHLWDNATDMVAELTRLRGQVQTYREMAEKRGDLLEACRAELRDAKKRA